MWLHFLLTAIVGGILFKLWRSPKNYPPGPFAFPLVGHIPYFAEYATKGGIQRLFLDWKLKFGPIIAVDFGSFKAVVLSDVSVVKEAWSLTKLTGRIQIPKVILRSSDGNGGPTRGVLFTHGRTWSEQRLFMLKHLKQYSAEKLDQIILPEAEEVLEKIAQSEGISLSTANLYNPAIINVIRQVVAGDRFSHDDPNLTVVMDAITEMMHDKGVSGLVAYLPQWCVQKFPKITGWNKFHESVKISKGFFQNFIAQRILQYEEDSTKDFIDAFITTMDATTDESSSFYGEAGKENLVHMVLDFFDAGVETTSTVMTWMILLLALHPAVQSKLQEEIDLVIGKSPPSLVTDRGRMPYTDAVIQETLRKSSAVPLALFHRSLDQVQLRGTTIPGNTIVISNLYGIHHDPTVWGTTVEKFDPDRFLGSRSKDSLAFGTGKRFCPGDNLAKAELFLLTVATLQKYSVGVGPGSEPPSMDQEVGGIIAPPKKHNIIFTRRENIQN